MPPEMFSPNKPGILKKENIASMFRESALLWQKHASELGEIDSRFGDGDHGVTMGKISALVLSRVDAWSGESIKEFIEKLASGVMAIGGGSAGPLYGTLIDGLGAPLGDEEEIEAETLKAMLAGSRDALLEITKARCGDKTMMDAVIPAVEAAQAAADVASILSAAAKAAEEGAKNTSDMVSKFGRARSYGEATLGTQDAGALSSALFFKGIADGSNQGSAD